MYFSSVFHMRVICCGLVSRIKTMPCCRNRLLFILSNISVSQPTPRYLRRFAAATTPTHFLHTLTFRGLIRLRRKAYRPQCKFMPLVYKTSKNCLPKSTPCPPPQPHSTDSLPRLWICSRPPKGTAASCKPIAPRPSVSPT